MNMAVESTDSSGNNQPTSMDADRVCPAGQQSPFNIETSEEIILHLEEMEQEELYTSGDEELSFPQKSCTGETSENPIEDLLSLCRLCATESDEMIPIFGSPDAKNEIAEQIYDCFRISVGEIDGVSSSVCRTCRENLGRFHDFRSNVMRANEKFQTAWPVEMGETSEQKVLIDRGIESTKPRTHGQASSNSLKIVPCEESPKQHSSDLADGKKSQRIDASHECPECGKKFITEERLRFHRSFHEPGARPCYCSKCDKRLVSESALYNHLRNVHQKYKEFCCDICGKQFRAQAQMDAHQRMHKDDRPFECNVCNKRFCSSEILKRHGRLHLPDKPNQCDQCGKRFDRTNSLTRHLLTHQAEAARPMACRVCDDCKQVVSSETGDSELHYNCEAAANAAGRGIVEMMLNSMYRCEYCERCYADVESAKAHKARHFGATPYVCRICDISYATYNQATAHKAAHRKNSDSNGTGDSADVPKYFTCQYCDKTFLHFTNMNIHRKTCGSGNDLRCRCCGNDFADAKELSQHKRGTDGDENLQCDECDLVFGSFCALALHKERHAKPSKQRKVYSCLDCGKNFRQKAHLTIHMRIHTGEKPYGCDLCSKSYRIKADRDNHRRTHTGERPFKCPQCDKTFANPARLREHKKFHLDVRPYKCSICDRGFKRPNGRKVHMTIHTGEKPFKCDICDVSFRRSGDMRKHKKTQHVIDVNQEK